MDRIKELELDLQAAMNEASGLKIRLREIDRQIEELEAEKQHSKKRADQLESKSYGIIAKIEAELEGEIRKKSDLQKPKAALSEYRWNDTPDLRVTRITSMRIYCREPGKVREVYYDLKTGKSAWDGTLDVVATLTAWNEVTSLPDKTKKQRAKADEKQP